jgi:GTP-binding protein
MLDEELMNEIRPTLPTDLPTVFISSVTGEGIVELKDALWKAITDDANRIEEVPITHRSLDEQHRMREEDEFIFEYDPSTRNADDEDDFDLDDEFDNYDYDDDDEDGDSDVDLEWKYGDVKE